MVSQGAPGPLRRILAIPGYFPVLVLAGTLPAGSPGPQPSSPGNPVFRLSGHTGEVYTVAFSPDGKRLASASNRELKAWNTDNGTEVFSYPIKGTNVFGLAFSPDGRRLAVGISKQVKILDAANGQEVLTLGGGTHFLFRLAFRPDGRHLAAAGGSTNQTGEIRIWDAGTGKEAFCLVGYPEAVLNLAYSGDGQLLASCGGATGGTKPGTVMIWEAGTGRCVRTLRGHADNVYAVAFSPDGRRLVSADGVRGNAKDGKVKLWELASGQEVLTLDGHTGPVFAAVFSPNGKRLATAGGDKTIRVWDAWSLGEVFRLAAHDGVIYSLAFSPDGKRLASAGADRIVKVWDLSACNREPAATVKPLSAAELQACWADLAGLDAKAALQGARALAAAPGQAVPFLRARMRPEAGLTAQQLEQQARWLRDLDDDRFGVREQACAGLSRLGEAARPALQRVLAGEPPLEVRRRAERLLEALAERRASGEHLAALRAVEVLERIGTPEAVAALAHLADGRADARLTREARTSLERLTRLSHADRPLPQRIIQEPRP